MSALDAVIGPELIARAEQGGACRNALEWLSASPRTWRELREHDLVWLCWGIAEGLAAAVLPELVSDPTAYVRRWVAARIAPEHLPEMIGDPYVGVRWAVAQRIDVAHLPEMAEDPDAWVRWLVAERLGGGS